MGNGDRPGDEGGGPQLPELGKQQARRAGLVGIEGNDFQVLTRTERQQRIVGAAAGVAATKAGAHAGLSLESLDALRQVGYAVDEVIDHCRVPVRMLGVLSSCKRLERYLSSAHRAPQLSSRSISISASAGARATARRKPVAENPHLR